MDSIDSRVQPLCAVCNSEHRALIDQLLSDPAQNVSSLMRYCENDLGVKFTRKSMTTHLKKHVNMISGSGMVEVVAENIVQAEINSTFDKDQAVERNPVTTLNYLIEKSIQFVRTLEKLHPSQIPHQHIQNYMKMIMDAIKMLKTVQGGGGDTASNININVINTEVLTVMREVAGVVHEMFPGREADFAAAVQARLAGRKSSIINTNDPMLPLAPQTPIIKTIEDLDKLTLECRIKEVDDGQL